MLLLWDPGKCSRWQCWWWRQRKGLQASLAGCQRTENGRPWVLPSPKWTLNKDERFNKADWQSSWWLVAGRALISPLSVTQYHDPAPFSRGQVAILRWKACVCSPVSSLTLDFAERWEEVSFSMLFTVNKDSVAGLQMLQKVRDQTASKTKTASRNSNTK